VCGDMTGPLYFPVLVLSKMKAPPAFRWFFGRFVSGFVFIFFCLAALALPDCEEFSFSRVRVLLGVGRLGCSDFFLSLSLFLGFSCEVPFEFEDERILGHGFMPVWLSPSAPLFGWLILIVFRVFCPCPLADLARLPPAYFYLSMPVPFPTDSLFSMAHP